MKYSSIRLAVCSATLFTLHSVAAPQAFLRPQASLNWRTGKQYWDGDYSTKAGVGLTGGIRLGREHSHEIGAELSRVSWREKHVFYDYYPGDVEETYRSKETVMPVVLNYRYRFGRDTQALRVFVGPSAGVLNQRWQDRYELNHGSYRTYTRSSEEWSFTCGGTLGITCRIGKAFEVDLGYRYSYVNRTWRDLKMHTLTFGAGMTF